VYFNWAIKKRYAASGLVVKKVKVPQKPVQALANDLQAGPPPRAKK